MPLLHEHIINPYYMERYHHNVEITASLIWSNVMEHVNDAATSRWVDVSCTVFVTRISKIRFPKPFTVNTNR